MQPSELKKLAAEHAARRLTRKDRNRELRAAGANPEGTDGAIYRAAFDAAVADSRFARSVKNVVETEIVEHSQRPDVIVLWRFPADDWPEWIRIGWGNCSLRSYLARLENVAVELRDAGQTVVVCHATLAEVLAKIREQNLPTDSSGRAAAVSLIWFTKSSAAQGSCDRST